MAELARLLKRRLSDLRSDPAVMSCLERLGSSQREAALTPKEMLLVERIVHTDASLKRSRNEVFAGRLCVNMYSFVSRRVKNDHTCVSHGTAAGEALRPRCLFE